MTPIIRADHLRHVYSAGTPFEKVAIDDIDLAIPAGQFVGIIGHTGSGKSTFIQHLNGLLAPTSGTVLFDGEDIHRSKAATRDVRFQVGLVFQYPEHQLFEETVYQDIAFGPKNARLSTEEVDARVREAARFAGVDESLFERSPLELSGGQKQRLAIAPSKEGEKKIVLATPIAETSLTIEGVRIVVDSGLCRKLVYDARTGLSHLETVTISKDMATQRRGRAGRVAEGICYRLWTQTSEHLMEDQRRPEIEEADLTSMVLDIAAFGENNPQSLLWLTPPSSSNLLNAKELLLSLEAIEPDGSITPLGRKMATLPCHPRIAKMMMSSESSALKALACDVAALLEEKDPMSDSEDSDMSLRLSILRSQRQKNSLGRWARIAQIAQEYRRMLKVKEDNEPVNAEEVGRLIALAYPERIAMAIDNIGHFRMSNGKTIFIDSSDAMSAQQWLAIASLNVSAQPSGTNASTPLPSSGKAGRVFLSAPVNINDLPIHEFDNISWDSKAGMIRMQRERRIGTLVVDSKPLQDADKQQIIHILCTAIRKEGLSMLDWNEDVQRLQRRVAQVRAWHPEMELPDLSTAHLMETAGEWLPFYLDQGGKLKTSTAELRKLNLPEILWAQITYEQQQEIDRLAPTHIVVPSGSHIRIDYRQGAEAPILSVRLQECFGMTQTPAVDDGRQPLLLELLSPGFKPVQLTQDLASFWQSTYFEVRKELKRRYPKHFWPENPLESEAVRGVKRKK